MVFQKLGEGDSWKFLLGLFYFATSSVEEVAFILIFCGLSPWSGGYQSFALSAVSVQIL